MDDLEKEEQAINAKAEDNSLTDTPSEETNQPEVTEESVQPEKTETSTEDTKTEGTRKVSGAEKRIHELVDERDEYKSKVEDLSTKFAELTAGAQSQGELPYQQEAPTGERELTLDDLRSIARLEVEKERTVNRINAQAREAQKLYPALDKDSDNFDPDVNKAVTRAVWLEVQKDPSQDVLELTETYMKPYLKAAESAVGREKETLAKQVNDSALRPSNIKAQDKNFAEKSIEEMEAELEIVY